MIKLSWLTQAVLIYFRVYSLLWSHPTEVVKCLLAKRKLLQLQQQKYDCSKCKTTQLFCHKLNRFYIGFGMSVCPVEGYHQLTWRTWSKTWGFRVPGSQRYVLWDLGVHTKTQELKYHTLISMKLDQSSSFELIWIKLNHSLFSHQCIRDFSVKENADVNYTGNSHFPTRRRFYYFIGKFFSSSNAAVSRAVYIMFNQLNVHTAVFLKKKKKENKKGWCTSQFC